MDTHEYRPILKRVGLILVVMGLLGIAVLAYCWLNNIAYAPGLDVVAIVAGILLVRGNLHAAAYVRWGAILLLTVLIGFVLAVPALQPVGLTLTELRLHPGLAALAAVAIAGVLALVVWVVRDLNRAPVLDALSNARLSTSTRTPAFLGIALIGLMLASIALSGDGPPEAHAREMAREAVGPGFELHVDSMKITYDSRHMSVAAVVIAWNEKEVRDIPVHWEQ